MPVTGQAFFDVWNRIVIKIMKLINSYGYDCYIVGGFVRDKLLNIESHDYDLCTNALIKDLIKILDKYNIISINYGTLTILIEDLKIEITTYRKEIKYYKRKPVEYIFVNTLEEDLHRRDFTINSICIDMNYNIIDLLGGINDINSKLISLAKKVVAKSIIINGTAHKIIHKDVQQYEDRTEWISAAKNAEIISYTPSYAHYPQEILSKKRKKLPKMWIIRVEESERLSRKRGRKKEEKGCRILV